MPFFQLDYLHQALTNRVRTKSSQTHQRFFLAFIYPIYIYIYRCIRLFPPMDRCCLWFFFHIFSQSSISLLLCVVTDLVLIDFVEITRRGTSLILWLWFPFSLCAFAELFSDYDAFLGHCLPSNPWLTSSTDRWDLLQPLYVLCWMEIWCLL